MAFDSYLRQLMAAKGMTSQRQLALYLHVSPPTVSKWASGVFTPEPRFCRAIAEYFHRPEEEVLRAAGHLSGGATAVAGRDPEEDEVVRMWRELRPGARALVKIYLQQAQTAFAQAITAESSVSVGIDERVKISAESDTTSEGVSDDRDREDAVEAGMGSTGGYAAAAIRAIGTARLGAEGEDGGADGGGPSAD